MADEVIWGTKGFQVPEYFNFADVIDEWAQKEKEGKRQSDHPALWWIDGAGNEVKWSYQDVVVNSKKTANILSTTADVKPGERVVMIMPTIPEYWLILAAGLRTGGVLAALPLDIGPKELHRRILMAKPVCVVVASCDQVKSELFDVVNQIASSGQVDIRSRIVVNRMKHEQWENWLSFENLFQAASADYQSVKSLSSAPTGIYFTSGTSGNAKMAEHSQASFGMGSTGIQKRRFLETDLMWMGSVPGWSWLDSDGFFATWSDGSGSFAHYKRVTSREFLETLQRYPITVCTFIHSMYMNALEEEDVKSFSFPTLRCCIGGGEPIKKQVLLKWKEETGIQLVNYYGQTEIADLSPGDDKDLASCGKAFPGVDMLIVDDNDQEVPPGTLGRVAVRVKPYRPVGMFTCYADDPEKTAACFSGDFYFTGDVGRMDAEGYFCIVGRDDETVICESWNIYPCEVENCLKEHPAVLDCAVVTSPNLMGQTTLKAFVVLSGGFKSRNQDGMVKELQDHVAYNTGKWMSPKKVEFIEDLPKTVIGKINKRELRNREWSTQ